MMSPSATVSRSDFSSAVEKPSASVKMRSISAIPRSSIETTSNFGSLAMLLRFAYQDPVETIDFAQLDVNALALGGWNILADEIGANWHLALAAIDQHRELNRFGTAEIRYRTEGGTHGAPGVEHIIDEDHALAIERERDVAPDEARIARRALLVVAIGRDIEGADRDVRHADLAQRFDETLGQCRAATHDADEHQVIRTGITLGDLMGETLYRSRHRGSIECDGGGGCGRHLSKHLVERKKIPGRENGRAAYYTSSSSSLLTLAGVKLKAIHY